MTIFDQLLEGDPSWGPNPILQDGFEFTKLNCEHLAAAVEVGLRMPFSLLFSFDEARCAKDTCALSGQIENGYEVTMVFSKGTMTEQPTADRFLQFASPFPTAAMFVCAERYSRTFLLDLEARVPAPFFPLKAMSDKPWFVRTNRNRWGEPVDDTCQGCLRLHTDHQTPCDAKGVSLWQEYRDEKWPRYSRPRDGVFNQELRTHLNDLAGGQQ